MRALPRTTAVRAGTPASRAPLVLAVLIAAYAIAYGAACVVKWRFMLYDDIDLAIFVQAMSNLMRGSLASSLRGMPWLGDHASLSLFLLAPLWAVAPHPLTLLFVQTAALALGAVPVFALARRLLGHSGLALGCAALWLLQPALGYANLFEFHPETCATPCLLAAGYFLACGRTRPLAMFATLALLAREDVALAVLALAALALVLRRPRDAALLVGLAVASLVLSFGVLKPALGGPEAEYGRMYAAWGGTPGEIAKALATRPLAVLSAMTGIGAPGPLGEATRQLHLQLLLSLGLLPLAGFDVALLALPVLAEHLLSDRMPQHTILYQYTALSLPSLVAAAVVGLSRLLRLALRVPRAASLEARLASDAAARGVAWRVTAAALGLAVLANLMFGPLAGHGVLQARRALQPVAPAEADRARARDTARELTRLPREGGVVAGFGALPRVAARREVHALHHVVGGRWTYSSRAFPIPHDVAALVGDFAHRRLLAYVGPGTGARMRALIQENRLAPVESHGDVVLMLRDGPPVTLLEPGRLPPFTPAVRTFDGALAFHGGAIAEAAVPEGGELEFRTVWTRTGPLAGPTPIEWVVLGDGGRVALEQAHLLGYLMAPPCDWTEGLTVRETYRLPLPGSIAPGDYVLAMRVGRFVPGVLGVPADAELTPVGRFSVVPAAGR